ncbi:MAG: hypothetical protein ACYTG6_17315 [Planctomycetota bacterium]|jgi:hypothetical protein
MQRVLVAALALVLTLVTTPVRAEDAVVIEEEHVRAALEEAGENAGELEAVLAHYEEIGDPQKITAARFLIANMPGKGYIVTELRDAEGTAIPYDPLAYPDFEAARAALEAIEAEHGEVDFARDRIVGDVETITAAYLITHIDRAFEAWARSPERIRVGFGAFLNYVLPYRGSQEPLDDWLGLLMTRYAEVPEDVGEDADAEALYRWISRDVHQRVRFNERYYLHPTDQAFGEMEDSGQGRCEDITNMITYAARSRALATAADYTPAWAHRDNNHAWNVLLDATGHGADRANAHAAKVYRKTFAIQRDSLAFLLPEDREAPNRFLQATNYVDVTDQYADTTDVTVDLDRDVAGEEAFAYLCVFNGGEWVAIHWGKIDEGRATFTRMGRNIAYLPAVHDGERIVPAAPPRIVHRDGSVELLPGGGPAVPLLAAAVRPRQASPDTAEVTPTSFLEPGTRYLLQRWDDGWEIVAEVVAGEQPLRFATLPSDGLYWLVAEASRRLERIFTIQDGRQRWW